MSSRGPNRAYWIAFAALMAAVVAVFWRFFFTDDVPFHRDIAFAHYPRSFELRALIRQGQLPLWNPFEHFGESVIGNPNYLLFYPTAWLAWILPFNYGFKLHYALHFLALAAGSYLLAWRIGLSPLACSLAGALFVFSGPVMSLGNFYNVLAVAAWIPWTLLAADRQALRRDKASTGMLAGCLALQLFAGEPLLSAVTAAMALGWIVFFYGDLRLRFWTAANIRLAAQFSLALALACSLAAVQLLPVLAQMPQSERAVKLVFNEAFRYSLQPIRFFELLLPCFLGDAFLHWRQPWIYIEGGSSFLLSVFIGITPVALAALAVLVRRDRATRFWLAVAVAAFVLALGRYTSFSLLFYHVIPVFRIVRFPAKLLPVLALAAAQLSAMAVDELLRAEESERHHRWARRVAAAVFAFALAWVVLAGFPVLAPMPAKQAAGAVAGAVLDHSFYLMNRQALQMSHIETVERAALWLVQVVPRQLLYVVPSALLLILVLYRRPSGARLLPARLHRGMVLLTVAAALQAMLSVTYSLNPLVSPRFYSDSPPVLSSLKTDRGPARFFAESPPSPPNFPDPALLKNPNEMEFFPAAAQLPYAYRMNLQVSAGTLGVENSFSPQAERTLPVYQALFNDIVHLERFGPPRLLVKMLALAGVEYALLGRRRLVPGPDFIFVGDFANGTRFPVALYRVAGAAPRAYLVPASGAVAESEGMATINRMVSDGFDPLRRLVLDRSVWSGTQGANQAGRSEASAGEAEILEREALRVEVETNARAPSYLVLTDTYTSDWQVSVDGERAVLLRANQMFRAVAVPAGTHRVLFRYRPGSLFYGAAITLVTLIGLAFWRLRGLAPSFTRPD